MLFNSETHQAVWIGHHCERCHYGKQPDPCKILAWALAHGRKPKEWQRNTRKGALMADTMKCDTEARIPPITKLERMFDDVPMFDVDAPVDMDTDHA